ncbi:putative bifunctional diguanylate cyclase/phosphodiesterase [Kineococcus radiotolerans]|uniref:putative bifunctional diguanylate cyclase/phosphodiesterase n=1 Tax=Kineococcus radiotolerans TaxID=131568 RepID=UPI00003A3EDA|nr:bifunctional diguanylate cyclase/phosphodiesterase [Kineococcus radiotolerans]
MTAAAIAWTTSVLVIAVSTVLLTVLVRQRNRARDDLARTDPLTGLGNRRALLEVGGSWPAPGPGPGLLLLDLDGFKDVNDTLGHAAGDEVLVQVAHALARTVGDRGLVVRLGGDEFAVLVPEPASDEELEVVAKRLLTALAVGSFHAGVVPIDLQGSIGIARAGADGNSLGELLQHADIAMYAAKRGRAGVLRYDAATDPHSGGGLELLGQFRGAMEEDQLELHYQPKVSGDGSRLLGFEALVRWNHPTRGFLLPADFLPFVERTNLIHPLTRWVLLTALRQAATWRAQGVRTTMAVNVSAVALDAGLLGVVEEALVLTRWAPADLVLEITETAVVNDPDGARATIAKLRDRGVRVSVDDFGAGSTSLGHLRGLPVHELKIDRQFVAELVAHPEDEAVVSSVITLAHRLGLVVVAEGVETAAVADRLCALGCDELQGFFFARPLPAEKALAWARAEGMTGAAVELR